MNLGTQSTTLPRTASAASGALAPGMVLDGRFEIVEVICRGGMATILKARDRQRDGEEVAVKVPDAKFEMDVEMFGRFQREEEIGASLDHPAILKFIPIKNKSQPYFVMECLSGKTLYHALRERGGRLPEAEALALAARICDALRYLHEHDILHRDLKPENIMLCDDGSIRVMDFGIAHWPGARRMTFIGFAPGTPHYMAPERIKGKRGDARTDIYSLGAVLYEMLTGVIAFNHEDISFIMDSRVTGDPEAPRKVRPGISEHAEEIVLHAMERDPEKRYQTAAAMQAELEAPESVALTGKCDRLETSTPWKRRWPKIRSVALWILIPLAAQIAGFLLLWHHFARHAGPAVR
ncbi:MAG: serine/threonine-protein kinase [Limisphaerales bacterium]